MSTSSGRPGSGSQAGQELAVPQGGGDLIAGRRDQGDHGRVHGDERGQRRPSGDLREPHQRGGGEVGEGRLTGLGVDQHVGRPGPGHELRIRGIGPPGPRRGGLDRAGEQPNDQRQAEPAAPAAAQSGPEHE